jgi:hypothetical protein
MGPIVIQRQKELAVWDFNMILRIIFLMTIASGILAIFAAVGGAIMSIPLANQLVVTFTDSFKLGMASIIGLIACRAGRR